MNVGELIDQLKKYPDHFEVECWFPCMEGDDSFAFPVEVTTDVKKITKTALIEMDGMPRP